MEPIYFGKNNELFGIFHSAGSAIRKESGVILCSPIGQEYIRSHRAMLKLAEKLSDNGFDVLRFDYYGCGDSLGNLSDINDLSVWQNNIKEAINELKEGCGIDTIYMVGLRYGATMLFNSCHDLLIDKVVLWNPVVNGNEYIQEISTHHKEWLDGSFAKTKTINGSFENLGFDFTNEIIEKIKSTNLDIAGLKADVLLIDNENKGNLPENITHIEPANNMFWLRKEGEMEKSLVPSLDIKNIVDWMTRN